MFIYDINELKDQGIVNFGDTELTIQGKILVKSISISKKLKQMAINICQQEKLAGRMCIAVENHSHLTLWKQKMDDQVDKHKKVNHISVKETKKSVQKIDEELITACQKQLVKYIGPIAKFIIDDLLDNCLEKSAEDFINLVAEEIPDSSQKEEFKQYFSPYLYSAEKVF